MVWVISSSWGSVDLQSRMYDQVVDPSSGALPLPANEGLLASSTPNAETASRENRTFHICSSLVFLCHICSA